MTTLRLIAIVYSFSLSVCLAQKVSISLAAFSIPQGAESRVHVRIGESESVPFQLSKSQFPQPIKISIKKLEIYAKAIDPEAETLPAPLLSVPLPARGKFYKAVLWSAAGKNGKPTWQCRVFSTDQWPQSGIILLNFSNKTIGLESGELKATIKKNETYVFKGKNKKNGSPVKLYQLDQSADEPVKLVFSSVWRIPKDLQELMLIYDTPSSKRPKLHSFVSYKPAKPENP